MDTPTPNAQPAPTSSFSDHLILAFRCLAWPLLMTAVVQIGALIAVEHPQPLVWIAQLAFSIAAALKLHQQHFTDRGQVAMIGVLTGLVLGFLSGLIKFLISKKFFTLFFLVTDPVLHAIIGGLVVTLVLTILHYPKFRLLIQRFIPNFSSHDDREKSL